MTADVDYGAIATGSSAAHAWVLEAVHLWRRRGLPHPAASHGVSELLSWIHRTRPALSCTCAPTHRPAPPAGGAHGPCCSSYPRGVCIVDGFFYVKPI